MKKRVFYLLLAVACVCEVNAQLRKIPSSVTSAFATRYPHADKIEWSDKLTSFEAGFVLNGSQVKAGFSSDGEWKYSEKKIAFEDLPAEVKDGFAKSKYSEWKKGSVTEIQVTGKELQYRIFAEKSAPFQKKNLYFNTNGKLLKDVITL